MKQPDQQIHDELMNRLGKNQFVVYPFLPPEDVSYPFIVMGVTRTLPRATKSFLVGRVRLDVHVWGIVENRKWVSDTLGEIREISGQINQIDTREWLLVSSVSEIVRDNSTNQVLYHGILELEYKFI